MKTNKTKINLANKICSILFFAFTIVNFVLSIIIMVGINGKKTFNQIGASYPFYISIALSIALNIYVIIGLFIENEYNYRNPMIYLLIFTFLFTVIGYTYCLVSLNKKQPNNNFTVEFWLLLVASGISVLFSTWNWLVYYKFLRSLTSFKNEETNESELACNNEINSTEDLRNEN